MIVPSHTLYHTLYHTLIIDDLMASKRFTYYWFFVEIIHQSSVDTPHKGPSMCPAFSIFVIGLHIEHCVEVLSMGDPIWIWHSGGPAVFATESALLRLTMTGQVYGATPVYIGSGNGLVPSGNKPLPEPVDIGFNLYLFCCLLLYGLLSLNWSPSINIRLFYQCRKYHL